MIDIKTDKLKPKVAEKIKSFIAEIVDRYPDNLHSIHLVGSSITEDFNEKTSDINSVFVLNEMDLRFVEIIAPLGKRHKKEGIAAPLIMTPDYIRQSLDVFPIEFLNFKIIHETIYGEDILNNIEIDLSDLRYQCERELKTKLIGLRQGYISSRGDKKIIVENLVSYIEGYIPLFRSIIFLVGKETAVKKYEVLKDLSAHTGIDTSIFKKVFDIKRGKLKLTRDEIDTVFEDYYKATEEISKKIDEYKL